MSPSLESNEDICFDDNVVISLFDVVVRIRRLDTCGNRFEICVHRSLTVLEADIGMTSVCGSPSPGNDVSSTLII